MSPIIEIKNVVAGYSGKVALSDVSFKIFEGESVAILGPNGSGKSTLLKLISGTVLPSKGNYLFNGVDVFKMHKDDVFMRSFYKKVGFLFQNPESQLFCPTVMEEVAFGPRQMEFSSETVDKRVMDCLDLLGIRSLARRIPYNLSEGEKKKVALSAVLSINPEILVLDEPMNGLDPHTKRFMRDFLIDMNKNAGKTIISATHDYEYVKGIFDRAIILSDKYELIYDGEFEAVIRNDEFLLANNLK